MTITGSGDDPQFLIKRYRRFHAVLFHQGDNSID
jgi:hypothetical protein